jgi:hypothetical protein
MLATWLWFYSVAWRYKRWLLKWTAAPISSLMMAAMAFACFDRAQQQLVAPRHVLTDRPFVLEWYIAAILLVLANLLLLSHLVWFGRGWRATPHTTK